MIYTLIMALHFLFDWVMQPRYIAKAKGKDRRGISAVMHHMAINIAPFSLVFGLVLLSLTDNYYYVMIAVSLNFVSHALIDIYLPKGNTERQMINWTAIDQILHLGILFYFISNA